MKVGILSVAHGHVGSFAACLKRLGVDVTAVYDHDEARGRAFAERIGSQFYASRDELLAQPDISAVGVYGENALHAELVIAAAKAGKHVMCEKPLATSRKEGLAMVEACRKAGVVFQTFFPCRWLPSVRRAKALIESGHIGRIIAIKGTNHGGCPGGWFVDPKLAGGGAVFDHTVHVTDLMRWITGSEPVSVYAEVERNRLSKYPIDDAAMIAIEFADGTFATLDPSWSRNSAYYKTWGDVNMEIIGTKGTIAVNGVGQGPTYYTEALGKGREAHTAGNMDFGCVKAWVDAIQTGRAPEVSGEDGLKAVEVALAAYLSEREQRPVSIREVE